MSRCLNWFIWVFHVDSGAPTVRISHLPSWPRNILGKALAPGMVPLPLVFTVLDSTGIDFNIFARDIGGNS